MRYVNGWAPLISDGMPLDTNVCKTEQISRRIDMTLKKIFLATIMTLALVTTSLAASRTGTMIGERTGTMIGERNGTMIGERTGTMIGERTGTMIGERTGIIPTQGEQGLRYRVEEDLISSLMLLLTNLSW